MGRAPISDMGAAAPEETNPDNRLDVFLEDLGYDGYYGYCTTDDDNGNTKVSAYCALDDDFAHSASTAPRPSTRCGSPPPTSSSTRSSSPLTSPRTSGSWRARRPGPRTSSTTTSTTTTSTSATARSRHPRTALDYGGGAYPYGSFIFFTYATAKRGPSAVRRFWDAAVGRPTSLQAIWAVVGASVLARLRGDLRQLEHAAAAQLPGAGRLPQARVVAAQDADPAGDHDRVAQRRHRAPRQLVGPALAGEQPAGPQEDC